MNNNISSIFFEAAKRYPDQIAIIHDGKEIRYSQLAMEVKQTMTHLRKKGIKKGSRVMIFVPMSIPLYRIVLAVFGIGAIAVFLDEWVDKARLKKCLKVVGADAFIGIDKALLYSWFFKDLRQIPIRLRPTFKKGVEAQAVDMEKDDTALITFTTGSTGLPKAANRTHGFLYEQFRVLKEEIEPSSATRSMVLLPIVLLCNLGCGATSVIAEFNGAKPDKMKRDLICQQIKNYRVNNLIASPFFILELARYAQKQDLHFDTLSEIYTGGAPVFPAEAALLTKIFSASKVEVVYGSTESEPISSIGADAISDDQNDLLQKGLAVGDIHPELELRVIEIIDGPIQLDGDQTIDRLTLPEGQLGEVIVAGKHVLASYYNSEKAFLENKIVEGKKVWHRTGDSARRFGNQLFLNGRCAQLIVHEGKTIAPFVYESVLNSLSEIRIGTILKVDAVLLLACEANDEAAARKQLERFRLQYDQLKFLQIPRDPRHHSKVDYKQLISLLSV